VRTPQRSPRDVDVGGSTKATTMREQFTLDRKYWIGGSLSYFGAVGWNLVLNHARPIARAFFFSSSVRLRRLRGDLASTPVVYFPVRPEASKCLADYLSVQRSRS
jgi:hypothetical protein